MEDLCKLLQMKRDEDCINWIRNAVEHCTQIMFDYKTQDSDLWTAMRSAFASDSAYNEHFMPDFQLGPEINPQDLRFGECTTLLTNIARDYFIHWPYIQMMEIMSIGSWILSLGFIGILMFFWLLYFAMYSRRKLNRLAESCSSIDDGGFSPKKEIGDKETNCFGIKTVVLKAATLNIDDEIGGYIFDKIEPIEILYSSTDNLNDYDNELRYKQTVVEEILNILENYPHKLRVIMLFDDIKIYDDVCKCCDKKRSEEKSTTKLFSRSSSRNSVISTSISRSRIPVISKASISHSSKTSC